MDNYLFYDLEVTRFDSLAVFKDISGETVAYFWSKRKQEGEQYPEDVMNGFEGVRSLIQGRTLVGYNNYSYDDKVLSMMMRGATQRVIKATNDAIIRGEDPHVIIHPDICSLDCFQQIDVSKPGLKLIEGNMGRSIIESSVDFNVDHPLTDEERDEMLRYCEYDVLSTIEVFKLRYKSYFETKQGLISLLPEDDREKAQRWNTTTISANALLGGNALVPWNNHRIPIKVWKNVPEIPIKVWEMWESATSPLAAEETVLGKGVSCKTNDFSRPGIPFEVVFGIGGLHGAPKHPGEYRDVKLADVGSMYPSIIVALNALDDATAKYDGIRKERLSIKHTDKVRADALKLLLNSVYGLYKSKYSTLFNPRASATVCIYGQIALFDLCSMLWKAGYYPININTDGVAYISSGRVSADDAEICRMWEQKYQGLNLEIDTFSYWRQKDVNNYVAITTDGKVKVKGGDVVKYNTEKLFSNNSLRIVSIALVEYLINGTDICRTIVSHLDKPELFQIILKAGGTYKGVVDSRRNYYQKVNRVFAAAANAPHTELYKLRADDGLVHFPDAPERMYIYNGDCKDFRDFADVVDIRYYVDLVEQKLKGWVR